GPEHYTLGHVMEVLSNHGEDSFLPTFDTDFKPLLDLCDKLDIDFRQKASSVLLSEIHLPLVSRQDSKNK
ncbi:MAG: hypothetical protein K2F76_06645, partial [Duncaniella dubosii]|nr:hypothetical protein [Duncaniella dubosii]